MKIIIFKNDKQAETILRSSENCLRTQETGLHDLGLLIETIKNQYDNGNLEVLVRDDNGIDSEKSKSNNDNKRFSQENNILYYKDLKLDHSSYSLNNENQSVILSPTEFRLLKHFFKHPGKIHNRESLLNISTKKNYSCFDRSIDVHISNLRSKLRKVDMENSYIKTYWGLGYMFE